ncbi:hypothetical protein [Ruminococcus sp. 5_1_39BFAA]|uniref:hypothetical protein n=1 Tax=Ruminococcus sp. 5_1_39BFAA TaxID=457412 RepID=UPI0035655E5B
MNHVMLSVCAFVVAFIQLPDLLSAAHIFIQIPGRHYKRGVGADKPFHVYLKGHSRKDNDLFFLAVRIDRHDIFLPDLCPDDPGMVFVFVSAGEEECSVDVCAPAEGFVVRCAAFRFSPVDRNNLRKI